MNIHFFLHIRIREESHACREKVFSTSPQETQNDMMFCSFCGPWMSLLTCASGWDAGFYRHEQLQREESTGVLSASFMTWHRARKLHPVRKAPELVTTDLTHVLSCRFWYECHDGYCGQMSLVFLPHHDPEYLLPRSWAHLVAPLFLILSLVSSRFGSFCIL